MQTTNRSDQKSETFETPHPVSATSSLTLFADPAEIGALNNYKVYALLGVAPMNRHSG